MPESNKINDVPIDEIPELKETVKRAHKASENHEGEPWCIWIRFSSENPKGYSGTYVVPDDGDCLPGCVMIYSTGDGWL